MKPAAIFALLFVMPGTAFACQPVVTLMMSLSGPAPLLNATGGMMAVFLLLVIAIKCYLYARLVGYGRVRAASQMFVANIISTLTGVFIGVLMASGEIALIGFVVAPLMIVPFARRCLKEDASARAYQGNLLAFTILLMALLLASLFAHLALDPAGPSKAAYFALKSGALFLSFSASIIMTVFIEAGFILKRMRKVPEYGNLGILPATLRATLASMLIAAIIGAAFALPVRLSRSDFMFPDF